MHNTYELYNFLELVADGNVYYDINRIGNLDELRERYSSGELQIAGIVRLKIAPGEFFSLLEVKVSMYEKFGKPWFADEFRTEGPILLSNFRERVRARLNGL